MCVGNKNVKVKFGIAADLLGFFWQRKLWWMLPMVAALLLVGLLLVFAQGSAIAPLVYALF